MSDKRVMVAMSGGVDSSVAAYLLKEEGFEVVGATMYISPADGSEDIGGLSSAIEDARKVAQSLGIPHYVFDMRESFEEKIITPFCKEYVRGRTPNPCVICNRYIKFGEMMAKALDMGMDYLATGHYARVEKDENRGRYLLYRGLDQRKDQSYVLFSLRQSQLSHTLFPLGELSKQEIREIASRIGLEVANRPESQEICFIPDNDYAGFVKKRLPEGMIPGPIEDTEGRLLGFHSGIARYTIGQRKGLGIAAGIPLYVVAIDDKRNAVIVGSQDQVMAESCLASDVNFIPFEDLEDELEVEAKIRYTAPAVPASLFPQGDKVLVRFAKPVRAITPGQAVVFYQGDMVVGGGTIELDAGN